MHGCYESAEPIPKLETAEHMTKRSSQDEDVRPPEGRVGDEDAPAPDNIANLPLTNQVATILRDMIIQDKLKPGERIRERQLSERLNVSRTPLREAIKILVSEKLVESSPNRGAVVADPEPENIRELLQVLGALEGLGGRLAAENATQEQIAEIHALHFEMLAAFYRKDKLAYFKINQRIHKSIMAASGNAALVETHEQLNARVYRFRYQSNQKKEKWPEAVDEHENIVEALEARDGARLEKILTDHLKQTWIKVCEVN